MGAEISKKIKAGSKAFGSRKNMPRTKLNDTIPAGISARVPAGSHAIYANEMPPASLKTV